MVVSEGPIARTTTCPVFPPAPIMNPPIIALASGWTKPRVLMLAR